MNSKPSLTSGPDFILNGWQEFSDAIYEALPNPVAFVLTGWLWGLEQRYIAWKARKAVDDAIIPVAPPEPLVEPPRHLSEPSDVEGLDTISYTYDFVERRPPSEDEG